MAYARTKTKTMNASTRKLIIAVLGILSIALLLQ